MNSTVKCGCGFLATGLDLERLEAMLDSHSCYPEAPTPWHETVFQFWGWFIIATIGFMVLVLVHPEIW